MRQYALEFGIQADDQRINRLTRAACSLFEFVADPTQRLSANRSRTGLQLVRGVAERVPIGLSARAVQHCAYLEGTVAEGIQDLRDHYGIAADELLEHAQVKGRLSFWHGAL